MGKCNCDSHDRHLCKLYGEGMHKDSPEQYAHLVRNPEFVCKSCGRVAGQKENLCAPVKLGVWEE